MTPSTWAALVTLAMIGTVPALRDQTPPPTDNAELARMFQEDQDDRKLCAHGVDWAVVKPRDDARLDRTRRLYAAGPYAQAWTGSTRR